MDIAKSQIDYKTVHNEYVSNRNTLLSVSFDLYLVHNQRTNQSQESSL